MRLCFARPDSSSSGGCSWSSSFGIYGARRMSACRVNWNCGHGVTRILAPAARLICEAYRDHPDSLINDQYRSVHGSMRFLNNIVRYSGCGAFSAPVSHVVVHRTNREFVGLVLGSRVSPESGHITQVCVHPGYRRHGMARMLLSVAAFHFMRQGARRFRSL